MIVEVHDIRDNWLRDIEGEYADGTFKYKEGGINFWFIHIGQTENNINIPYEYCYTTKTGKRAMVVYDGKSYTAINPFAQMGDNTEGINERSLENAHSAKRIARLQAQAQIKKPFGFTELLQTIIVILLMVGIVGLWGVTHSQASLAQNELGPVSNALQVCKIQTEVCQNQSRIIYNESEACISALSNVNIPLLK
jgi:hypothetical protein